MEEKTNEMDLKKSDTSATESSGWSQGDSSQSNRNNWSASNAFLTPIKQAAATVLTTFTPKQKEGKLKEEFGKDGRPSPPKNNDGTEVDMEITDVEKRMNQLVFFVAVMSKDDYGKLCWIIGKGLDKTIIDHEKGILARTLMLRQILSTDTAMGKRFDTVYRSDGDRVYGQEDLIVPEKFMEEKLGVDTSSDNTYTIYSDEDHDNIEYFSREQTWGNCHMQGPILLHWLLSLWHDKNKKAKDVSMIHMSKYLRNVISNEELYKYVVEEEGCSSFIRAEKMMPEAFGRDTNTFGSCVSNYEDYVEELKKRGPALVEMNKLYTDFQEEEKLVYAGVPPKDSERLESGHGMLLIGVSKDTKIHPEINNGESRYNFKPEDNLGTPSTQVHLLLQNWWPHKPIMKVRLDYFLHCEGRLYFSNGEKVKEVNNDSYSTETGGVRRAVTAASMDKGIIHRGVKSLDF